MRSSGSNMVITQTIAGITRESGGPSYSVPSLSAALSRLGVKVTLRTLAADAEQTGGNGYSINIHSKTQGLTGAVTRMSASLRNALLMDSRLGAIVHCHGLWLMPNVYPAWARRKCDGAGRLVHSTRGMLSVEALRISAWKKRPFWWLSQRSALSVADCLHATAVSEYEEIRAAGLRNPVTIIPNGIDLPELGAVPRSQGQARTALSLGRIHPKKGLDRLIRAWATIEASYPDWRLRIVGPAEERHDEELRALALSLGARRISIESSIFGAARLAVYRSADLFLLSTLNENFAMTVAEALAAEVPVISTKGAPWAGLERERCGWWIDHGVEPMAAALRVAMDLPRSELHAMGGRGRAWMARDFGWDRIAGDMLDVYRWLKDGGPMPSTVRIN